MTKKELSRESFYLITMGQVKKMLRDGIVNRAEYSEIEAKLREKYRPTVGTLFADIDLL